MRIPQSLRGSLRNGKARAREIDTVLAMVHEAIANGGIVDFGHPGGMKKREATVMGRSPQLRDIRDRGLRAVVAVGVRPADKPGLFLAQPGEVRGAELIQAAIDPKTSKLKAYRRSGCPEQWLLVVGSTGTVLRSTSLPPLRMSS